MTTTPVDLGNMTKYDWASAFLGRGGWPVTAHNLAFVVAWIDVEGTKARWNPLATTRQAPGSTSFNSVGVQNFTDFISGLDADIGTVKSYGSISAALATGDPGGVLQPNNFWGSYSGGASHGDPTGSGYVARFKGIYGNYLNNPNVMKSPLLAAGAGSTSSPGSGGGAGTQAQTANPQVHFRLPSGGTLYKVNGTMVVAYKVGTTLIYYDASEAGILSRVDIAGIPFGGALTGTQFNALGHAGGLVHGGVWSELAAPDIQKAGNYNTWVQGFLATLLFQNPGASKDPTVTALLLQYAAGNIGLAEFQLKLRTTDYWKTRTDQQRLWAQKSPADQKLAIQDELSILADVYFSVVGRQIDLKDPTLLSWATKIASGESTTSIATSTWLRPIAVKDPQSPWSRSLEQELENQRAQGVDISNHETSVREMYKTWGVPVDDATVRQTASALVTKTLSDEQLRQRLQQQAAVMYPGKPADMETATWAQPWVSTYQRVMEQPGDLTNGSIAKALQNGQIPYEFEKELKQSDAWLQTTNGRQANTQAFTEVARRFGMVK